MRTAIRTLSASIAAVVAVLTVPAAAASAAPPPARVQAVTTIQDRPDSGNGGYWAGDSFARVLVITRTGGTAGHWTFTATLSDFGTFTTIPGAPAPNQGGPYAGDVIRSAVTGFMGGSADFAFTASTLPVAGDVPRTENDHGLTPADSTSTWYELAFPAGTVFGGPGLGSWSWSYAAFTRGGLQHWTDAWDNGFGDLPGDGQITG
jgi:hypothetical protein